MKTFNLLLIHDMISTGMYLPDNKTNALTHELEVLEYLVQVINFKFSSH